MSPLNYKWIVLIGGLGSSNLPTCKQTISSDSLGLPNSKRTVPSDSPNTTCTSIVCAGKMPLPVKKQKKINMFLSLNQIEWPFLNQL